MTASQFMRLITAPLLARTRSDRRAANHRLLSWLNRRAGFRIYNRDLYWIDEDPTPGLIDALERPVEFNDRKRILQGLARSVALLPGDTAECGTFEGASSWIIAEAMKPADDYRHHIFDSFEGLSEPGSDDRVADEKTREWVRGDLCGPLDLVKRNLSGFDFIDYHRGWIPEAFPGVEDRRFKFVHIDVDLYQPTRDSLEFFYPRMVPGGVILCDDYGSTRCPGAHRAMDEFFEGKPEGPVVDLLNGQGLSIKRMPAA